VADGRVEEIKRKQVNRSDREGLYETTNIFEGKECEREQVSVPDD
jgi:hypothetical protein